MRPYFHLHALAGALFGVTLAVWLLTEFRQSRRSRAEADQVDGSTRIGIGVSVAAGWLIAALSSSVVPSATIPGGGDEFAVGIAIAWLGIGLRWWAFRALGRYFTFTVMTSADQPVISQGPYKLLRHPGYSGAELTFIGLGIIYGNWIGLAALAVLPMVGLVNRIRVEEQALNTALGDAYRSFASDRRRMIPFIW